MKKIYKSFAIVLALFTAITVQAGNFDMISTPDLGNSSITVVDHVGDITGDSGMVQVVVRDVNGKVVPGIVVNLSSSSKDAILTSISGKTDANGTFSSNLISSSIGMYRVTATIDTDADGVADSVLANQSASISILEDLAMFNGVGINIETPDESAVLHVFSTDRGVMIPRVALQGCSDKVTILDPALSLLVFNTNASDSLDVGYVYFDGTDWKNFRFQ
ncbi:MAG: Ig-like domain-containing protein [Nonlabens sp.]